MGVQRENGYSASVAACLIVGNQRLHVAKLNRDYLTYSRGPLRVSAGNRGAAERRHRRAEIDSTDRAERWRRGSKRGTRCWRRFSARSAILRLVAFTPLWLWS